MRLLGSRFSLNYILATSASVLLLITAPNDPGAAQTGTHAISRPLPPAERQAVVRAAAEQFEQNYVFEAKAKEIAAQLRSSVAPAAAKAPAEPEAFAKWLTGELRRIGSDRHLEVAPPAAAATPGAPRSRAERLSWLDRLRRRNYDFATVERLAANVGYLRLNSFPPPEVAADTAAAAMAFLKHSDALIIDLRTNGGGTGDMVRLLASYFFAEPTRLSRTFRRHRVPQVTYDMTVADIPGERMPIIDVFVLTSEKTFSAAEGFAFALQELDRAKIVGEKTGGGGNAGDWLEAAHGFSVFVPDVAVSAPYSERRWEGVGVQPDIPAPAAEALRVSHRIAVERLMAAAADSGTRERYQQVLDELAASPTR